MNLVDPLVYEPLQPEVREAMRQAEAKLKKRLAAIEQKAHGTNRLLREEVTEEDIAAHHLVLYGGPAANAVTRRIARRLPVRIEADGSHVHVVEQAPVSPFALAQGGHVTLMLGLQFDVVQRQGDVPRHLREEALLLGVGDEARPKRDGQNPVSPPVVDQGGAHRPAAAVDLRQGAAAADLRHLARGPQRARGEDLRDALRPLAPLEGIPYRLKRLPQTRLARCDEPALLVPGHRPGRVVAPRGHQALARAAQQTLGVLLPGDQLVDIADGPEEFAGWVIRLMRDEAERERLARSGRKKVVNHFGWDRMAEEMGAEGKRRSLSAEDLLATATAFTVRSASAAIVAASAPETEVYLCGGGARNRVLAAGLADGIAPRPLLPLARLGVDPDGREAAGFAVLAGEFAAGNRYDLRGVTGSRGAPLLGVLAPGTIPSRMVWRKEKDA